MRTITYEIKGVPVHESKLGEPSIFAADAAKAASLSGKKQVAALRYGWVTFVGGRVVATARKGATATEIFCL